MAPTSFPPRFSASKVVYSEAVTKNDTFYSWEVMKVQGFFYVYNIIDTHLDTVDAPYETLEAAIDHINLCVNEREET